jgi:hypothetical protein
MPKENTPLNYTEDDKRSLYQALSTDTAGQEMNRSQPPISTGIFTGKNSCPTSMQPQPHFFPTG